MPIPREILDIPRPKSTRVRLSGERYLVIKTTSKRIPGRKNPKCIELGTIGEIVNGKYRKIRKEPRRSKDSLIRSIDIKDYGQIALCDKVGASLLDELCLVYDIKDAKRLYVIALLRAAYPDVRDRDLQFRYETSYASELYPGIALSENTISGFLMDIGQQANKMKIFMNKRMNASAEDAIVVDGMLKGNNSISNTFSEFTRKGRVKGSENISIMHSYSLTRMEPVASRIYPGNMIDLRAATDFMEYCGVKQCAEFKWITFNGPNGEECRIPQNIVVGDKGFMSKETIEYFEQKNIPYLLPLKLDSMFVTENKMNGEFYSVLEGYTESCVFYKKACIGNGRFLYAYRDVSIEKIQKVGYIKDKVGHKAYNEEKFREKSKEFGLIVFISNANLTPIVAYLCYKNRWDIEPIFQLNKTILDLDTVNVHGDYRLYSSEFISFLASIIGCRIRNLFNTTVLREKESADPEDCHALSVAEVSVIAKGNIPDSNDVSGKKKKKKKSKKPVYVADDYTYPEVLKYIAKCKCMKDDVNNKWHLILTLKYIEKLITALGIVNIN